MTQVAGRHRCPSAGVAAADKAFRPHHGQNTLAQVIDTAQAVDRQTFLTVTVIDSQLAVDRQTSSRAIALMQPKVIAVAQAAALAIALAIA